MKNWTWQEIPTNQYDVEVTTSLWDIWNFTAEAESEDHLKEKIREKIKERYPFDDPDSNLFTISYKRKYEYKQIFNRSEVNKMKFEELNKRYTQIIIEYLSKGYYINTGTMSGNQGEYANIHITNGQEIICIFIQSFHYSERKDKDYYDYDGVEIVVGRCTEKYVKPNKNDMSTVWNSNLEIISEEKFYQIGEKKRHGIIWYGTKDEADTTKKIESDRWKRQYIENAITYVDNNRKNVVLSFVKRQPKCKSIKLSDIEKIIKTDNGYRVIAKGNAYYLK